MGVLLDHVEAQTMSNHRIEVVIGPFCMLEVLMTHSRRLELELSDNGRQHQLACRFPLSLAVPWMWSGCCRPSTPVSRCPPVALWPYDRQEVF
jgi:hypothetical protein